MKIVIIIICYDKFLQLQQVVMLREEELFRRIGRKTQFRKLLAFQLTTVYVLQSNVARFCGICTTLLFWKHFFTLRTSKYIQYLIRVSKLSMHLHSSSSDFPHRKGQTKLICDRRSRRNFLGQTSK